MTFVDITKKSEPCSNGMTGNLTNDRFLNGKNLLPIHLLNHCKKITKSTEGKDTARKIEFPLREMRETYLSTFFLET